MSTACLPLAVSDRLDFALPVGHFFYCAMVYAVIICPKGLSVCLLQVDVLAKRDTMQTTLHH